MTSELINKINEMQVKFKDDEETLREILTMIKNGMEILFEKNNIK